MKKLTTSESRRVTRLFPKIAKLAGMTEAQFLAFAKAQLLRRIASDYLRGYATEKEANDAHSTVAFLCPETARLIEVRRQRMKSHPFSLSYSRSCAKEDAPRKEGR